MDTCLGFCDIPCRRHGIRGEHRGGAAAAHMSQHQAHLRSGARQEGGDRVAALEQDVGVSTVRKGDDMVLSVCFEYAQYRVLPDNV